MNAENDKRKHDLILLYEFLLDLSDVLNNGSNTRKNIKD